MEIFYSWIEVPEHSTSFYVKALLLSFEYSMLMLWRLEIGQNIVLTFYPTVSNQKRTSFLNLERLEGQEIKFLCYLFESVFFSGISEQMFQLQRSQVYQLLFASNTISRHW